MNLERLTIVIPSRNRQQYILRAIEFWSKTPVQLVILDGTESPIKLSKEIVASEKIQYVHAVVPLEQRLGRSTEFIKTEYAAVVSDDEFFLPSSLANCVKFLDDNIDYVACKGLAISFGWDGQIVNWRPINKSLKGYKVDSENRSERMFDHLANYAHASWWSVQRSEVYIQAMKAVGSNPAFPSAPCVELQVSLIASFYGKIMVLDELMWLRSYENESLWWAKARLSVREWWRDMSYHEDHKRFIGAVISHAIDEDGQTPSEEEIKTAMEALVRGAEERYKMGKEKKRKNTRPDWYMSLNKAIKTLLNNTIYRKSGYPGYSLLSEVQRTHADKYKEVSEVVKLVNDFQSKNMKKG
ncbi:TIGR00180 family glycosyltransferase [Flagellimonas marinaquae]